jgi:uncharacterized spore protein YtfJ
VWGIGPYRSIDNQGKELNMSLNKLFDSIEQMRDAANWRSVFGEPQVVEDRTLIPVAQVGYGFGLGFGRGEPAPGEEDGPDAGAEGGGGGGGASAKPLGVIVVTPEDVHFEDVRDDNVVAIMGIALSAFAILQVAKTVRALFGR